MIQYIAPLRTSLVAALLALGARPASAQEASRLEADAYGAPSGPGVIQSLGLLLEHVPTSGGPGSLRLFGGVPGQPAALLVASAPGTAAGPDGTARLIAEGACVIRGTFDATGAFTVPVSDLPRELLTADANAQGLQAGELAWGPIRREGHAMSQGLRLARVAGTAASALALSDLGPRLPARRRDELDSAFAGGDLTAFLASALDSDGGEVLVKLDGDVAVTVYPGISLGAKGAFEVVGTREHAGACSVFVGRRAAMLASVGLGYVARCGLASAGTGGSIGFEALANDRGDPLDLDRIGGERVQDALTQAAADRVTPQP